MNTAEMKGPQIHWHVSFLIRIKKGWQLLV